MDRYIYGDCPRLCPDAPVPVFSPSHEKENMGMAGNVHKNLIALGVNSTLITNPTLPSKTRYVDEATNHILIRVDSGEKFIKNTNKLEKTFLEKFEAIILSDYNKGFLKEADIRYICQSHPCVFLDTKKIISDFCKDAKFIKINQFEYANSFVNFHNPSKEWVKEKLIITKGRKGCVFNGKIYPVSKVEIRDFSGAGDTFLAGLVCEYLDTENLDKAIKFANQCATIVVQKKGVSTIKEI